MTISAVSPIAAAEVAGVNGVKPAPAQAPSVPARKSDSVTISDAGRALAAGGDSDGDGDGR